MRFLSTTVLALLLSGNPAFAADNAERGFALFSPDGRYFAYELYGIQDGSGLQTIRFNDFNNTVDKVTDVVAAGSNNAATRYELWLGNAAVQQTVKACPPMGRHGDQVNIVLFHVIFNLFGGVAKGDNRRHLITNLLQTFHIRLHCLFTVPFHGGRDLIGICNNLVTHHD